MGRDVEGQAYDGYFYSALVQELCFCDETSDVLLGCLGRGSEVNFLNVARSVYCV